MSRVLVLISEMFAQNGSPHLQNTLYYNVMFESQSTKNNLPQYAHRMESNVISKCCIHYKVAIRLTEDNIRCAYNYIKRRSYL